MRLCSLCRRGRRRLPTSPPRRPSPNACRRRQHLLRIVWSVSPQRPERISRSLRSRDRTLRARWMSHRYRRRRLPPVATRSSFRRARSCLRTSHPPSPTLSKPPRVCGKRSRNLRRQSRGRAGVRASRSFPSSGRPYSTPSGPPYSTQNPPTQKAPCIARRPHAADRFSGGPRRRPSRRVIVKAIVSFSRPRMGSTDRRRRGRRGSRRACVPRLEPHAPRRVPLPAPSAERPRRAVPRTRLRGHGLPRHRCNCLKPRADSSSRSWASILPASRSSRDRFRAP
jgi:hypothetical protein